MSDRRDDDTLLRAIAAAPAMRPPRPATVAFPGNDRFVCCRRIGEGSFGVVYDAIDQQTGAHVALKVLRRPTADWLYRFKREFRTLADFSHPNVVQLYELSNSGDDWFFTMQLVEGEPFVDYVRRCADRLPDAFAQLARGLEALHAAGIIHRDVKPSNVLVTAEGRVVVLDFGLAVEDHAVDSSAIAGTPLYMAPEQGVRSSIGPAVDWYAVGVMLYEALTGRAPFDGPVLQMLAAKLERDPPEPRALAPTTAGLNALCMRLLAREPSARADARAIVELLDPLAPAARPAPSPPFVGRRAELSRLVASLASRARGRPAITLVRGASGMGKTALLGRFVEEARRLHPDAIVLAARCFEREAMPFKALDGIVDALARHLLNEVAAAELLPRDVAALTRLFPVLEQVPSVRQAMMRDHRKTVPAESAHSRGTEALRDICGRIADRRALVIVVDDLQWGDADSAALLADIVCGPNAPALCFVGAARDGEDNSPFLRRLAEMRAGAVFRASVDTFDVPLTQLDAGAARELVTQLLISPDGSIVDALVEEGGGSPFFLGELARHAGRDPAVPRLDDVIRRRLRALSPAARALLEVTALVARPTVAEVLLAAAEGGDAAAIFAELRTSHLLRFREDEDVRRLEIYHDRIREAVSAEISATARCAIHLRLAAAFERRGDEEQVALHLLEAGDRRRAAELTVLAAKRSDAATAFDHAANLYRKALSLFDEAGGLTATEALALESALAQTLSSSGRCADAADAFLSAARHSEGPHAIELRRRAAEELLQGGHLARGRQVAASVLAELRLPLPKSPNRALASALLLRARLRLTGGLERAPRRAVVSPPAGLVRIDTLWALISGLSLIEPVMVVPLFMRHALLSRELGDPYRLLRAYVVEAMATSALESDRDGGVSRHALERAQALLPDCERPAAELLILVGRGIVDFYQARFPAALRHATAADELAQQSGLQGSFEATMAVILESACRYTMGHVGAILAEAPAMLRRMQERGNVLASTALALHHSFAIAHFPSRGAEALATLDDVMKPWSGVGVVLQHFWGMLGEVDFRIASGDGPGAWAAVERLWPELERRKIFLWREFHIDGLWARGRAALAAATGRGTDRARLLKEAELAARRIDQLQTGWSRGFSLALRGGAALIAGDTTRAAQLLGDSEPLLEALHIDTVVAALRETRGRLLGGATGEQLRNAAEQWRVTQGLPSLEQVCRIHLPTGI